MSDSSFVPTSAHSALPTFLGSGRTAAETFRGYVLTRKYDFGRGTASAWSFIAFARGDPGFPDAQSWRELHTYLIRNGVDPHLIEAARTAWRSFKALQSRFRREWAC